MGPAGPLRWARPGQSKVRNKVPLSPEDHTTLGAMESLLELVIKGRAESGYSSKFDIVGHAYLITLSRVSVARISLASLFSPVSCLGLKWANSSILEST